MEMIKVASSNLSAVGYDEARQELQVEFKDGKKYAYADVPVEVFNELLGAKSVGSFFMKQVRGQYEARKVG